MILFDAHCHLDMNHFKNDRDKVIERAKSGNLLGMVTSSIGPGSFRQTLGIVEKHQGFVHHSAGCSVSQLTPHDAERILTLIERYSSSLVAIGEVGLDYHWIKDAAGRKAQEPLFEKFIEIAQQLDLPLVIHSRKAEKEAVSFLERRFEGQVVMHCFDGPPDVATKVRDNGWYITLPANFLRSKHRRNAATILPLEQIMLETDSPYLSPTENRRNEPTNVVYGAEDLANLLDISVEDVSKTTTSNALRFYGI